MAPSDRLRVLIVGIYYAPEVTGIAPYTTGVAEHFSEKGHSVEVICGFPHFPEWRSRPILHRSGVNPRVKRYWHFVPSRPSGAGRLLYEGSWLLSASRGLVGRRWDVVIGVVPTLSGGILAWRAARKWGAPLGIIFQDLMGPAARQSGYPGGRQAAKASASIEGFVARRADEIVIISEGFRPYLEQVGVGRRVHRIANWTHIRGGDAPVEATRRRLGWAPEDLICLYSGNMGQKQGLDNLLESARLLKNEKVRVVLSGHGNDRERLVEYATRLGIRQVSFIGLQPAGQYEDMLRAADVLLVSQRPEVTDMSMPSKLTSYFAAGRPVVAAVSGGSATAAEVEAAKAGVIVPAGDPSSLARTLIGLRDAPEKRAALGRNGESYASTNLTAERALAQYDTFLVRLANR